MPMIIGIFALHIFVTAHVKLQTQTYIFNNYNLIFPTSKSEALTSRFVMNVYATSVKVQRK